MTDQGRDRSQRVEAGEHGIVAVIPAHNEERYIGSVVLQARQFAERVIVVDDGSTDGTSDIARAAGAEVHRHDENVGKGAALNSGFQQALNHGPGVIVTLDGDFQHLPQEVPAIIAPILEGEADIVVGSRYLEGDSSGIPRVRVWGHRAFNLILALGSGLSLTDSQSGFRAFSPDAARALTFRSTDFSVESEMQFIAQELGLNVIEVSITARYQDRAKRNVFQHGLVVLNGVLRLVGQYRPLLFFGVPGLATLLAGILWGGHVVRIYQGTQELAIGYALISVLLMILGSLSLFTGVLLHSVRGLLLDVRQRRGDL